MKIKNITIPMLFSGEDPNNTDMMMHQIRYIEVGFEHPADRRNAIRQVERLMRDRFKVTFTRNQIKDLVALGVEFTKLLVETNFSDAQSIAEDPDAMMKLIHLAQERVENPVTVN